MRQPQAKEDKIAFLLSMRSQTHTADPQPEPPPAIPRPPARGPPGAADQGPSAPSRPRRSWGRTARGPTAALGRTTSGAGRAAERLVRACVASMNDSDAFGPLVAAEAQSAPLL